MNADTLSRAAADMCPGALNIKGEHFPCDLPTENGRHDGWAHANRNAGAIWTDDPAAIHAAWAGAEESGR